MCLADGPSPPPGLSISGSESVLRYLNIVDVQVVKLPRDFVDSTKDVKLIAIETDGMAASDDRSQLFFVLNLDVSFRVQVKFPQVVESDVALVSAK